MANHSGQGLKLTLYRGWSTILASNLLQIIWHSIHSIVFSILVFRGLFKLFGRNKGACTKTVRHLHIHQLRAPWPLQPSIITNHQWHHHHHPHRHLHHHQHHHHHHPLTVQNTHQISVFLREDLMLVLYYCITLLFHCIDSVFMVNTVNVINLLHRPSCLLWLLHRVSKDCSIILHLTKNTVIMIINI